jgi:hypothetical protein
MVTHSIQAASRAGRVLFIKDGCVFNQIYRGRLNDEEMYRKISDTLTILHTEKDVSMQESHFMDKSHAIKGNRFMEEGNKVEEDHATEKIR